MLSLRELQVRTYRAIAAGRADRLLRYLVDDAIPARTRVRVYANNLHETGRKTLTASYPVVEQLVGSHCFRNLAWLYLSRFPSRSGDLGAFGAAFPIFLTDLYHDTTFAYLSSVAELEWACVESGAAAEAAPIAADALSQIDEPELPELGFDLHPALRLVSSPHCAFTIWEAHQSENFDGVDPFSVGENVLVYRHGHRVVARPIDAPAYAFISALKAGRPLLEAHDAAAALNRDFEPAGTLRDLYGAGLLVGFRHQQQQFLSSGGRFNVTNETR